MSTPANQEYFVFYFDGEIQFDFQQCVYGYTLRAIMVANACEVLSHS